ncbi:hypothetical protein [Silvimonas sp.]|uniref:ArnT family glycosyltransferase n=1 Tax=Silvimonas sp. TaxID=2650811 RepID=UPI00284752A8|nr:hypothetical protein [Silvimonas sp.]MDR3429144.1 hypothetical protein [Silvimonas sp.]
MRDLNLSSLRSAGDAAHRLPIVSGLVLLAFVLAWLLPGLVGHEPWKPDEGYTFGLVENIVKTGDWVVPTLAGEPFMEKPPIFFVTAAYFLQAFGGWMPLHDAARLASGFWLVIAMVGIALATRQMFGKGSGRWAIFLLLGCIGLPLRAHQLITDTALFAGMAWGICGLTYALSRPIWGGIMLGLGGTVSFLSKGLLGPGCLGLTAILLPVLLPAFRNSRYAKAIVLSVIVGAPLPVLWMFRLYTRNPELFQVWFRINNFGRFNGTAHLGPAATPFFYLKTLPWYAFPALPLTLWGFWRASRGAVHLDAVKVAPAVLCFLVSFGVLVIASDARELYAMPLLAPLAMLGVAGLVEYREPDRGWSAISILVTVLALILMGLLLTTGYALSTGEPHALTTLLTHRLFVGWMPAWHPANWVAYGALLLVIVMLWRRVPRGLPAGFVWRWSLLIVMTWGGIATLWLPALDFGMRYREVFMTLKPELSRLNDKGECVASLWLGEPQRALLDYYTHYRTLRLESSAAGWSCHWLLIQSRHDQLPDVAHGVQPAFVAARPGDFNERYMLFQFPQTIRQIWPDDDMRPDPREAK